MVKLEQPGQGRLKFAGKNHPPIAVSKIGVLIANLGTPDRTDYWSMRRYLSEFLSDTRVIDYPKWLWQPLLQLIILSKRPFSSGEAYKSIWNDKDDESPLLTITKQQLKKLKNYFNNKFGQRIIIDFCMRYGNPSINNALSSLQNQQVGQRSALSLFHVFITCL